MKVLIVSENISMRMGGEASLPFFYFKRMKRLGVDVYAVCHARVRDELRQLLSDEELGRVHFVEDAAIQRFLHRLRHIVPRRVYDLIIGQMIHVSTQRRIRSLCRKQLIQELGIEVILEPAPITPKGVSFMFRMGVPVVIGPMCGGLDFPPAFRHMDSRLTRTAVRLSRIFSRFVHRLIPGKLEAAALIVANPCTAKSLPKGHGAKVYEVVESGVDLSVWEAKSAEGRPECGPVRFVYSGRFVELKGVHFLVAAFTKIAGKLNAELDLVGAGPLESAIKETVAASGVQDKVRFYGWQTREEAAKIVRECDVFVLPSLRECGGTVLLEAMAMGLPIICCNWAGPGRYVDETVGIRVEPASPDAFTQGLADAMLRLGESDQLRQQMGVAGPGRVRSCYFDWDSKTKRVIEILEETRRGYESAHACV